MLHIQNNPCNRWVSRSFSSKESLNICYEQAFTKYGSFFALFFQQFNIFKMCSYLLWLGLVSQLPFIIFQSIPTNYSNLFNKPLADIWKLFRDNTAERKSSKIATQLRWRRIKNVLRAVENPKQQIF